MGDIVPFIARVRDSGDWSAAERARLEAFGEQLAASGVKIEIIFGTTDEGDPWCVVKDQNEDILVHVARIGGRFVVYSAIDDVIAEDSNLHEALRDRLDSAAEPPPSATVLPFGLAREAQTFIALLIATAFFHETGPSVAPQEPEASPIALAPLEEPPLAAPVEDNQAQDREVVAQGAVLADATAAEPATSRLLAVVDEPLTDRLPPPLSAKDEPQVLPIETKIRPPAAAVTLAQAEGPGETVRGHGGGERLEGGAGADTLRGGALDTLKGGGGDDRLELAGATAFGGDGADTFVILAPTVMGHADTLLGVIADFSAAEGDRIVTGDGSNVSLAPPNLSATDKSRPPAPDGDDKTQDWTKVEVDLDGDGVMDGYILVRPRGAPEEGRTDEPQDRPDDVDVILVGHTLAGAQDPWAA